MIRHVYEVDGTMLLLVANDTATKKPGPSLQINIHKMCQNFNGTPMEAERLACMFTKDLAAALNTERERDEPLS